MHVSKVGVTGYHPVSVSQRETQIREELENFAKPVHVEASERENPFPKALPTLDGRECDFRMVATLVFLSNLGVVLALTNKGLRP